MMLFSLLPLLSQAGALTAKELQDIDAGKVIIRQIVNNNANLPGIRVFFTVDAHKERIWAVLTDSNLIPEIFMGVKTVTIIRKTEEAVVMEYQIQAGLFQYRYVLQRNFNNAQRTITWERVSGDFKFIRGSWQILETGRENLSLLMYESFVDTGFFIPGFVQELILKNQVMDITKNLRSYISKAK